MPKPRLILVGGFLGAGKTTLLAQAAERLVARGLRVGLITNDQAANLVDTAVLQRAGHSAIEEVSGGCFCCRFDELIGAADELVRRHRPDVLIGEPVGSCTDLSATVIQPIKRLCAERFRVAPFSVLVDTGQMRTLHRMKERLEQSPPGRFPQSVLYIYQKQLEEADLIVLNKADAVLPEELARWQNVLAEQFPQVPHVALSALNGDGVDAWLDWVLGDRPAGERIAEVDYDVYAEGEALLGWLNASIRLRPRSSTDWRAFCLDLVTRLQRAFSARGAEIAHLKCQLTSPGSQLAVNLTASDGEPSLRGSIEQSSGEEVTLLVNARVRIAPDALRSVVEGCLQATADNSVAVSIDGLQSFSPARPQPVYRFESVQ